MTEAHANPELVAFHRESELAASQRAYETAQTAPTPVAEMPTAPAPTTSAHVLVPPKPAPATNPAQNLFILRVSVVVLIALALLFVYLRRARTR